MTTTSTILESINLKIKSILEIIENISDERYITYRDQISLIVNQLHGVLESSDEATLLKPLTDNILSTLINIENYVNSKNYSSTQNYLFELLKCISFLSNTNNKNNSRAYHSAISKNVSMLETDTKKVFSELQKLNTEIEKSNKDINEKKDSVITAYNDIIKSYSADKKNYDSELLKIKNDFDKELINNKTILDKKLDELEKSINEFSRNANQKIQELVSSASEKMGYVAGATYSDAYKTYSDNARTASRWWYGFTICSMLLLVGLSIWWFIFTNYSNNDYLSLIAKVIATIGVAAISRYCAIQASKNKTLEIKLRKTQLQMRTFDAFVASLEKSDQDKMKIELTQSLITQKDWLEHDKDEIDVIKEFEKIASKLGYSVKITKNNNDHTEN